MDKNEAELLFSSGLRGRLMSGDDMAAAGERDYKSLLSFLNLSVTGTCYKQRIISSYLLLSSTTAHTLPKSFCRNNLDLFPTSYDDELLSLIHLTTGNF